jgi:hypothetical protein
MSGLNFFFADASEAFHLSFDIDTCQPILMDPGTTCTATVVYAPIRVSPQDTATLTVGLTDKPDVKATLTLDGSSATPHPGLVVGSAQSGRLVRQGTMWTGVPIGAQ